jgi:hypothetical protein
MEPLAAGQWSMLAVNPVEWVQGLDGLVLAALICCFLFVELVAAAGARA